MKQGRKGREKERKGDITKESKKKRMTERKKRKEITKERTE